MTHTITPLDLRMARSAARRYRRTGENTFDADFESAAMQGLAEAAKTYDGTGSWQAYARRRINSRLANALSRHVGPVRAHVTTVAPDDLPDTAAPDVHEITNPALDAALERLPVAARIQLITGDIDRRRPADRAALTTLRKAMS